MRRPGKGGRRAGEPASRSGAGGRRSRPASAASAASMTSGGHGCPAPGAFRARLAAPGCRLSWMSWMPPSADTPVILTTPASRACGSARPSLRSIARPSPLPSLWSSPRGLDGAAPGRGARAGGGGRQGDLAAGYAGRSAGVQRSSMVLGWPERAQAQTGWRSRRCRHGAAAGRRHRRLRSLPCIRSRHDGWPVSRAGPAVPWRLGFSLAAGLPAPGEALELAPCLASA